jgi:putative ABC transport system substrate-binding protein
VGLVASLARPGGNLTGTNFFGAELGAKRLELLRELVPAATRVAVLVNSANAEFTEPTLRDVEAAARAMGLQIQVLNANTSREIDAAFATVVRERPDALFVGPGPFFISRRVQLANLAARSGVPAIYPVRENALAGGLISYGASLTDAYRQVYDSPQSAEGRLGYRQVLEKELHAIDSLANWLRSTPPPPHRPGGRPVLPHNGGRPHPCL